MEALKKSMEYYKNNIALDLMRSPNNTSSVTHLKKYLDTAYKNISYSAVYIFRETHCFISQSVSITLNSFIEGLQSHLR